MFLKKNNQKNKGLFSEFPRGSTFLSIQGRTSGKQGFTLVELVVTITIFTLITGVIIFENSKFNSSVLLTDLSFQVALTLRQAQVYGLSSKKATVGDLIGKTGFQTGYGVYFDTTTPAQARTFILFADSNDNKHYDSIPIDEKISLTQIGQNNNISKLCLKITGVAASGSCSPLTTKGQASIIFKRPNPEPILRDEVSSEDGFITEVRIILSPINDASKVRCVIVNAFGQIAVKGQGSSGC